MDELACMATFAQIVENGSFSKAARVLGISPTKASLQIQALERRLSVALLSRTTRHLVLTAEGETYHRHVKEILRALEVAKGELKPDAGREPSGRLRVGAPAVFLYDIIIPTLPAFCEKYPGISLEFQNLRKLYGTYHEYFDVMMRFGPLPDSTLKAFPLGSYRNILAATPAYVARCGAPGHPDEIPRFTCIKYINPDSGLVGRWHLRCGDEERSIDPGPGPSFADGPARLQACLQDLGIWVGPLFSVQRLLREGRLVQILPRWEFPGPTIYLVHASEKKVPIKVRAFIDHMLGAYPPNREIEVDFQA